MRRTLLILVLFGLGVALIMNGCGSDGSSDGRTLTKKQFVRLTEKFCEDEYKPEEVEMEKYADKHGLLFGGGEPWEQEVLNEVAIYDYVRDKIDYFKSLPAPEGDEKEVRAMIKAFEDGLRRTEENPAVSAEARPGAKPLPDVWEASYKTTGDYGPWLCGQP